MILKTDDANDKLTIKIEKLHRSGTTVYVEILQIILKAIKLMLSK